ncbi:hypothetical protein GCM10025864_35540 [Luteimicrobium album]|uniref:Aminoglycoside phosphotransferase domain-containing protein n=1 Tax=Luteimicrobium album TaxID=1054550 RepID=A0ABQ6I4T8_9MICO|nr:hypothetical protein GCM10025864_35540 [Luteimicrobium album]
MGRRARRPRARRRPCLAARRPAPGQRRRAGRYRRPPDELAAVVDFGDVTGGDPASDLATAWLSFDAAGHTAFRAAYAQTGGADDATWVRARAWAASLALALLAYPDAHPLMAEVGRHAVARLSADDDPT